MSPTPRPLAPALARRVAPLALLAGLTVGVALPLAYRAQGLAERSREAGVQAGLIADQVSRLIEQRPRLWTYDTPRLRAIAAEVTRPPLTAHLRLDTFEHPAVFTAGRPARPDDRIGYAVVTVGGRRLARVELRLANQGSFDGLIPLWIGAGVAGLLLAAGLFFLPLASVRRGDRTNARLYAALEAANAHLEERVHARTAELEAQQRQLQDLGTRLVQVQEAERARISRDLHDDLGQVLTGLRLQLTAARAALSPGARADTLLAAAIDSVDAGVEQVRSLAHALRPAALDGLGLRAALRDHAEQWASRAGLTLALDLAGDAQPPPELASVLFRVAQEALTNIARHARASRVHLQLGPLDDGWQLIVDDDGQGLPPNASAGGGLGLVGARERVTQAGGYLDLDRSPLGGARLLAWLPAEP